MSNIIKAVFGAGKVTKTKNLYQYDHGIILKFIGINLPDVYEVHFSNYEFTDKSKPQLGNAEGVLIPAEYLRAGKDVWAFVYLHTGESDGETEYKVRIPVIARPEITDEEPTPEEQRIIEQAIATLNSAVQQTASDVQSADASAQDAESSAEAARQAKQEAETAQSAAVSAQEAAEAAGRASADSSLASAQSASTAQSEANRAKSEADRAESATVHNPIIQNNYWWIWNSESEQYENSGVTAVGEDGFSPYIELVPVSGGTLVRITDFRGTSEFTVINGSKGDTGTGISSTSFDPATNTLTLNYTDGTSFTTPSLKGETGNGIQSIAKISTQGLVDTYRVTYTNGQTFEYTVTNGSDATVTVDDELSKESENPVQNKVIEKALTGKADIIITSASGTVASFTDGAEYDAVGMTAEFAPYQEGSDDPSPTNVRPIHGWTGLDINTQHGKNLFDKAHVINGYLFRYDTGLTQNAIYGVYYVPVKPGQQITYSGLTGGHGSPCGIGFFDSHMQLVSIYGNTQKNGTITIPNGVSFASVSVCIDATRTQYYDLETCQVEVGSVATAYEPYNGTTTPISWQTEAGEVFGGYVDVTRGKLVAEYIFGQWRWGDRLNSATLSNNVRGSFTLGNADSFIADNISSDKLCNVAKFLNDYTTDTNHFYTANANGRTYVFLPIGTSEDTIVQVACKLATPIEYDITPATIELLLGYNNVWTNAGGNVDVQYRADTTLYLEVHAPKVDDVQVNGTSVVNQGVANVPMAGASTLGVVCVYGDGLAINSAGRIRVSPAISSRIKEGTIPYVPVGVALQHESTFYGLAKAASDTTQSQSSNPVGTYTDEAKVAIQKMLGIYEAPWELIREDSVTNTAEADVEIAVDGNGQPFELTDLYLEVWLDALDNAPANVGSYGAVKTYYGTISLTNYFGVTTVAVGGTTKSAVLLIENRKGAIIRENTNYVPAGNSNSQLYTSARTTNNRSLLSAGDFTFDKLVVSAVTGKFSYRLYGRRKWS